MLRIASLCLDGSLRVWEFNSTTGQPVGEPREVDEHRKGRSLCWSSDGRLIATGGNEGEVLIWDANTFQVIRRFQDHDATVRQILFLDEDRTLVTVSNGPSVCIRDLTQADRVIHVQKHHTPLYTVAAFRTRDEIIATNGETRTYHAGAYLGEGLHEGAVTSALNVAELIG